MTGGGRPRDPKDDATPGSPPGSPPESLAEVLASIRALVSAETAARVQPLHGDAAGVLMLTPAMRVDRPDARVGEILAEGVDEMRPLRLPPAPILDEEALRDMVNLIVREELQGELGERISRNLRKLIRQELSQLLEERRET